ncbi:hypothetical protein [Labrys sp. 22185]|uniref:hypothetical protein n=1 Tax=Labrys sp. 22185 TaxID=3453888 RepID=UPI003F84C077
MRFGLGFVKANSALPPVPAQLLAHGGKFDSPAVTTYSLPITVPASSKTLYLLVGAGVSITSSSQSFSSVTWNGIAGTSLVQTISSNSFRGALFLIAVPPRGSPTTADVICNYSSGSGGQNKAVAAWILPDIASTTPTDTAGANSNGAAGGLSVALTTTANDVAVAYVFQGFTTAGAGSVTWTANVTEDFDATEDASSVALHSGARGTFNATGSKTITSTPSKTASGRALVAVSFPLA